MKPSDSNADLKNRLKYFNSNNNTKENINLEIETEIRKAPMEENIKFIFLFTLEKKIDLPSMTDEENQESKTNGVLQSSRNH